MNAPIPPPGLRENVALAPLTTFELGGPARFFVEATTDDDVARALAWAHARGLPVLCLGGGSNVVIADAGFDGLVVRIATRGLAIRERDEAVEIDVAAGEPWDDVVAIAVARGLAGIECLSGIPGLTGAVPIQNVGAYGQEVAETLMRVRALDRAMLAPRTFTNAECAFGYRDGHFKRNPDAAVVLGVTFRLHARRPDPPRYKELAEALPPDANVGIVRDTVIELRRRKSMVHDRADPNHRSAGSFFTNPVVPDAQADHIVAQALREGLVTTASQVPRFPAGSATSKLSAAWLIERAGFPRGTRRGPVGLSSSHALALVHHGGGSSADLLALAHNIRLAVARRFGVTLTPEPVIVGASLQPAVG